MVHPTLALPLLALALAGAHAAQASPDTRWHGHYIGTVGDLPVQADLAGDEDCVRGSYFYLRSGGLLLLEGKSDKDGGVVLQERPDRERRPDDGDKPEPRPSGSWRGAFTPNRREFRGAWTHDKGRPLPVRLTLAASYQSVVVHQSGQVRASLEYPLLLGGSALHREVNQLLRKECMEFVDARLKQHVELLAGRGEDGKPQDFVEHDDCVDAMTLRWLSDDIVSVLGCGWGYTGGAHGNSGFYGRTFVLRDGKLREIELSDVLRPGAAPLAALSKAVLAGLRRQGAADVRDGTITSLDHEALRQFHVSPAGITFHFAPYEVDCYVAGAYEVTVGPTEIRGLLDPACPIAGLWAAPVSPAPAQPAGR